MSLIRQLWLAVIAITILAFTGSFILSMVSARDYLEEQLAIKNNDNAASLALSMSQMDKDPVTVELQVAALFDSGQYALIRVIDPEGKTLIEKSAPAGISEVPDWFVRLFPITSPPGSALVSSGWTRFGSIELVSHSRFAYRELWKGAFRLLLWFIFGGIVAGLLGTEILRRVRRPLDAVVGQANAIGERRFIRIEEPATPELKSLARAMNTMVMRVKAMFEEEAARLDQVRREATQDHLTGLANRDYFMNQLTSALADDDAPAGGSLIMLRLADLAGINRRGGRENADEVLRRLGTCLQGLACSHPHASAARLNGSDFALLLPGDDDPAPASDALLTLLREMKGSSLLDGERIGHIGSGVYHHGENLAALLSRVDGAIAAAECEGNLGCHCAREEDLKCVHSNADWRKLLEQAIATRSLRLIDFPVSGNDGRLLHLECPLRLQAAENGEWLAAGSFMPVASRLAMTSELDLAAARLALDRIAVGAPAVALNLAGESIADPSFRDKLYKLFAARKEQAARLWLEVAEAGAFQHFDAFVAFMREFRPFGCRLGIEHFGRQFDQIGRLHDIGLDYLKVDASFIRGIDQQTGNQAFLKGLCSIAHNIGLTVIAEGVSSADELSTLPLLGFDGATGPAVSRES